MFISVDDNLKEVKIYISKNNKSSYASVHEYYSELKKYREKNYLISVFLENNNI